MPPRPPRRWLVSLLLAGAVAGVYGQTVTFDFVNYDDEEYVVGNPHVSTGLTWDSVAWAFTTTYQANWHPLTWISLMVDAELAGVRPAMFHLTNVLLHAANVLLIFAVLYGLTGALSKSAFVAAVLAVHPLHVESVAWVAERKDVLAAFFGFLGLAAYARWVERRGPARFAAVGVALAASLLSKPTFVTFPFLLLLLDVWPLRRLRAARDVPRLALEKAPFFALAAVSSVVTVVAQRAGGAMVPIHVYPLGVRLENVLVSYVAYLQKAVWPTGLAIPYPHPRGTHTLGALLGSGLLLAGITLAVVLLARARPYLTVGWLWYVGTLVPMIGLVQVGIQARADRYAYVPLLGISMIVAWGGPELAERLRIPDPVRRRLVPAAAVLCLAGLAATAFRQASLWRDGVTLFENTVRNTRRNETAENNLGSAYYARGRMEDAVTHYAAAVSIQPRYAVALNNLAGALNKLGRADEAIARWQEAVQSRPDYTDARSNLAGALYKAGRTDEAIAQCEAALSTDPLHGASHYNLGLIRMAEGRLEEARIHLEAAVRAAPEDTTSLVNLGVALARLGRFDEAIASFEEVLRLDPDHEGARRNLARARSGKESEP